MIRKDEIQNESSGKSRRIGTNGLSTWNTTFDKSRPKKQRLRPSFTEGGVTYVNAYGLDE